MHDGFTLFALLFQKYDYPRNTALFIISKLLGNLFFKKSKSKCELSDTEHVLHRTNT